MLLVKMELGCNFKCEYCYQREMRSKGVPDWNLETVLSAIEKYSGNREIVIHGGEPLTLPDDALEKLLRLSYEKTGKSSLQTNGYLISQQHIELFKKYKTSVGLSLDGYYPCNKFRGVGDDAARRQQTERVIANLHRLVEAKVPVSIIAVISKANAIENRELFKKFILDMDALGVRGRMNPCCSGLEHVDLTIAEAKDFYGDMYQFLLENGIHGWSPWKDIINSLQGKPEVVCIFRNCDPYATQSATPILPNGEVGVCLRLYADGKIYLRAKETNMRSDLLAETECNGCVWFQYCMGGCSGSAYDFDWRHKDRFCDVWKMLFERTAKTLQFIGFSSRKCDVKQCSHSDGIEHIDGATRHLDGFINQENQNGHTDGVEHLDGCIRHLDGFRR